MVWIDIEAIDAVDHLSEEELKDSLLEYVRKLVREDLKKWEDGRPARIAEFEERLKRWHEEKERNKEEENGIIRIINSSPRFKPSPPRPKIQDKALELMHSDRLYLVVNILPIKEPEPTPSLTGRTILI